MRRAAGLAVAVAILGSAAGCRGNRLESGDARLILENGARVVVGRPGDPVGPVTRATVLSDGASVRVVTGQATVAVENGLTLTVRQGSEIRLGPEPTLVSGELLVNPASGRSATVRAAGTRIQVWGTGRIRRDLAVSAASYDGRILVRSAGRRLAVPALRQATVTSLGEVPGSAEPLEYDAADPWDRRYLGEAIDLGSELEARSRGFTASLRRGEGRTLGFYRLVLPDLENEPGFDESRLSPSRPPGETLVGSAIALAGRRATFAERFDAAFAFRDQGAGWGLVALDQGVTDVPDVVRSLDAAVARAPLAFPPPPVTSRPRNPSTESVPTLVGVPTGPPSSTATPTPTAAPPTTTPTPSVAPPTASPPTSTPLLSPLVDLLAGLLPGVVVPQASLSTQP